MHVGFAWDCIMFILSLVYIAYVHKLYQNPHESTHSISEFCESTEKGGTGTKSVTDTCP
eukprot:m.46365 g.46365  ORF g.46365 m.46365 type:complete len:59 (-) comp6749_c0_seq1:1235-1411(-)